MKFVNGQGNITDQEVVPHVGTWIEIGCPSFLKSLFTVVPHVGTWIEIVSLIGRLSKDPVVPHVGTWIEIAYILGLKHGKQRRSSRRNVD